MKATFDREFLHRALSRAVKFAPKEKMAVIPSMNNVKIDIGTETADLTTCNATAQLIVKTFCKAKEPFSFCVNVKLLLKTVSLYSDAEVTITKKSDAKIEVKSGKSKSTLSMDCKPEDFTSMSYGTATGEFNINEFYLKKALNIASPFIGQEGTTLEAINICNKGSRIVFFGNGSAKGCRVEVLPISINKWDSTSIYEETAANLVALMGDSNEVTITTCVDKVSFFTNNEDVNQSFHIISSIPTAKYPNAEVLFTREYDNSILINKTEFKQALKRLDLFSGESVGAVGMSLQGNSIIMTTEDITNGHQCEEEISVISKVGVEGFAKFMKITDLLSITSNINENDIWLFYKKESNLPVLISPKTEEDERIAKKFVSTEIIK